MEFGIRSSECGMTRKRLAWRCVASLRMRPQSAFNIPHSGLTLVELLIVITILVLLVSSALPVLSPSSEGRLTREASRMINSYLTGAQARAIQTGRPYGVILRKLSAQTGNVDDRGVCVEIAYVEQPAPYAGFDQGSRVMLGTDQDNASRHAKHRMMVRFVRFGVEEPQNSDRLPPNLDPDLPPPGMFRKGDLIEIGGRTYRFIDDGAAGGIDALGYYTPTIGNPSGSLFVEPVDGGGPDLRHAYDRDGNRITSPATQPLRFWTEPHRYKIIREPTVPLISTAPPLQLPEGAAIDLRGSGTSQGAMHRAEEAENETFLAFDAKINNDAPIVLLFSPEGTIRTLVVNRDPAFNTSLEIQTVYLLVGLRENIPAPIVDFAGFAGSNQELDEQKATINWLNGEARWVSIAASTGAVATSVNTFVDPVTLANNNPTLTAPEIRDGQIELARELAKQKAGVR